TDIFSFGAVLYEMTTGRKAFSGRSRASLIGAILKDEPPAVSTVERTTPPALDRVIKTCLAKDPEERWQTDRDLGHELKWDAGEGLGAVCSIPGIGWKCRGRIAWFLAAILAAGLAAALILLLPRRTSQQGERQAFKLSILPPEKSAFIPGMIALSRDGSRLAFVATGADGRSLLWVRPLDSLEARALPGTEDAYAPFWSSDGRFIG